MCSSMLCPISKLVVAMILLEYAGAKEYCQFETFNASCAASNQVIVMDEAQYGRLRTGRCVSRDYGYVGCSMSVLHLLDRSCSGRRSCEVPIPRLRDLVQPCPKDLIAYLDASYHCITVVDLGHVACNTTLSVGGSTPVVYVSGSIELDQSPATSPMSALYQSGLPPSSPSGSSVTTSTVGCPLVVRAKHRQTLNITVYSFAGTTASVAAGPVGGPVDRESGDTTSPTIISTAAGAATATGQGSGTASGCAAQLMIVDGRRRHVTPLCPLRQRERNVYQSYDSQLGLYFQMTPAAINRKQSSAAGAAGWYQSQPPVAARWMFVVKIEASGCADPPTPVGTWLERTDDHAVVRCNSTHELWYLTCVNGAWIGSLHNCSAVTLEVVVISSEEKRTAEDNYISFGVVIAVASGIVLGFIVGFVLLLVVFLYRHRNQQEPGELSAACRFKPETGWSPTYGGVENVMTTSTHNDHHGNADATQYAATASPIPQQVVVECRYNSSGSGGSGIGTLSSAKSTLYGIRQLGPPPCCAGSATVPSAMRNKCSCRSDTYDARVYNVASIYGTRSFHQPRCQLATYAGNDVILASAAHHDPAVTESVVGATPFRTPDLVMAPLKTRCDLPSDIEHAGCISLNDVS